MGKPDENQKARETAQAVTALSSPSPESGPRQEGRRLILKFIGGHHPELDRVQFQWSATSEPAHWQQGDPPEKSPMTWSEVPQALTLIFLHYLIAGPQTTGPVFFTGARQGSPAASLGIAISNSSTGIHKLFQERLDSGATVSRVRQIFAGKNVHGKDKDDPQRRIFVRSENLPPDCIEVYWGLCGPDRIFDVAVLREIDRRIRADLGIPIEPPPVGEGAPPKTAEADSPPSPTPPPPEPKSPLPESKPPPAPTKAVELPAVALPNFPELVAVADRIAAALAEGKTAAEICVLLKGDGITTTIDRVEVICRALAQSPPASPPEVPAPAPAGKPPSLLLSAKELALSRPPAPVAEPQEKPTPGPGPSPASEPESQPTARPPVRDVLWELKSASEEAPEEPSVFRSLLETTEAPTQRIEPALFSVVPASATWDDDGAVLYLGEGEETSAWTLRNSFEGVLILGAPGSGKTSGSGATLAEAYLRTGFGGLVLTVKKDEAEHWRKLCERSGRGDDFIAVSLGGPWKLNLLAYEAQRPGKGGGLAENLVSFCRNLLKLSSRHQGGGSHDPFWQNAGDQLLTAALDLFLLSGTNITFDALSQFIAAAPTNPPAQDRELLKIPNFGKVLEKAHQSLRTPEDQRVFRRALEYWLKIYPGLADKTRTSITIGIFTMLDAFRGRGIPDLISSETTITPEIILSGMIVVLDLPLKEFGHTGLLVQSAWKYLFQTALERQGNTGDPGQRPVFLWEDEAQYFFSDHDHHFQDTARASRVSRVLLSQNLHNFYKEFGKDGAEAANSVFGNLNTKIFHANFDPETNEWAAKQFGTEIHTRFTISHAPPSPAKDMWDAARRMFDPPNTTSVSAAEQREYAVQPADFARLRTGGPLNNFEVDAYITWLGLSAEHERHFTKATFNQPRAL